MLTRMTDADWTISLREDQSELRNLCLPRPCIRPYQIRPHALGSLNFLDQLRDELIGWHFPSQRGPLSGPLRRSCIVAPSHGRHIQELCRVVGERVGAGLRATRRGAMHDQAIYKTPRRAARYR